MEEIDRSEEEQGLMNPTPPCSSMSKTGKKRKHYDTTADVQLRVLLKEEELQRKMEKILDDALI